MKLPIVITFLVYLSSCGWDAPKNSDDLTPSSEASNGSEAADVGDRPYVFNNADYEEKGGETFPEYDQRRDSYNGARGSYRGQGCTADCSGHEAGYRWAENKGINDPDDCGGKSWSFIEGCRAYAE